MFVIAQTRYLLNATADTKFFEFYMIQIDDKLYFKNFNVAACSKSLILIRKLYFKQTQNIF
jgi:hypothetical protein